MNKRKRKKRFKKNFTKIIYKAAQEAKSQYLDILLFGSIRNSEEFKDWLKKGES